MRIGVVIIAGMSLMGGGSRARRRQSRRVCCRSQLMSSAGTRRPLDEAAERKWTVVDMKTEWKTVFPNP